MDDSLLQNFWDSGKFTSSWIISAPDLKRALEEVQKFAHKVLAVPDLPLANNPDFRVVERGLNASKNEAKYINVEQIRELQHFMYNTSAVSACKIAVIYEADLMNINASNCCLKILEEAPRDSYIFLLTSYPDNIIATIKSRCLKVRGDNNSDKHEEGYADFVATISSTSNAEKVKYIQDITGKDVRSLWKGFCDHVLKYLHSTRDIKKFDQAQKFINDTTSFDLDKRHMGMLILELL
jgi:DNA polymerase-3 subunit delta'